MEQQKTENRKQKINQRGSRGFTLLLAALVSSIVLALGASIFNIAQKQLTLSSIGRDSQFAFYAADTVAECALYWDFRYAYFDTTEPDDIPAGQPTCDGQMLVMTGRSVVYPYTMTSAQMDIFQDTETGPLCAQVSVTKTLNAVTNTVHTVIRGDGYSTSCGSIASDPRVLQRSVGFSY